VMNQLHLSDAPTKVDDPWSARGLLEGTGTLLGMLPSFWLTNRAIGGLGGLATKVETAETVTLVGGLTMSSRKFALAEAGVTGGIYGGVLTPNDNTQNFWGGRAANAGFGATAVMAMGWSNLKYPQMSQAASGAIGGTIGGAINAEGQTMLFQHKLVPDGDKFAKSVFSYGAMGAIGARFGPAETRPVTEEGIVPGGEPMTGEVSEPVKQSMAELRQGRRLMAAGSVPEAVQSLEGALSRSIPTLGSEHPLVADQMSELGHGYFRMGKERYLDAEASVQKALEIRTQAFGPDSREVARTLEQLSNIQSARVNPTGAAESLHASLRTWDSLYDGGRLEEYEGEDYMLRRRNTYERVASLYQAGGDSAKADEIMQSLPPARKEGGQVVGT